MKEKLLDLNYKLWTDFKKRELKEIAEQVAEREMNDGIFGDFYMKFLQQNLSYKDGEINSIAIACCIVVDNDEIADAFCLPAFPFFIKSLAEVQCLNSLIETFLTELCGIDENIVGQA